MKTRSSKEFKVPAEPVEQQEANKVGDQEEIEKMYSLKDAEQAKELFTEGKRHFVCGNVADAAKCLSEVCTVYGGYYGETAAECGLPYYYYGRTLLELARKEPDVVAHAVEGIPMDEGGDDEEENGDEGKQDDGTAKEPAAAGDAEETEAPEESVENVREQVLDALEENAEELEEKMQQKQKADDAAASGESAKAPAAADAVIEEKPEEENAAAAATGEKEDKAEEEASAAEETEEDGENEGEDDTNGEGEGGDQTNGDDEGKDEEMPEEISNLQLSWEMLDLARVIFEKIGDDESKMRLAECRLALGEQAIEDEQFDKAVAELNACIELQKEIMQPDDRRLAVGYFNMALAHSLDQKYEEAIGYFKTAASVLELRRDNLTSKQQQQQKNNKNGEKDEENGGGAGGEKKEEENGSIAEEQAADLESEIKELSSLITDVQNRIQDCVESQAEAVTSKQDLKKFESGDDNGAAAGTTNSSQKTPSDDPPTNVSHLVRKAVKHPADSTDELEAKKQKVDETVEHNGSNEDEKTAKVEEKVATVGNNGSVNGTIVKN